MDRCKDYFCLFPGHPRKRVTLYKAPIFLISKHALSVEGQASLVLDYSLLSSLALAGAVGAATGG